jgi:DNA-binding CsgD family transcriptional regulator/tetratricopeptide (TPR) repeat protein
MGSPLWERGGVSELVAEVLDAARAGRGGALFVEGEAGLGKSSILSAARSLAEPDLLVGLGQGDAMETSVPFAVLDQALATIGGPTLAAGPQAATARPEQLYRLLRWLETSEQGVLIALDDVHWADSDSLELLSLLCRRISSLPAAIIATLRAWPEDAREAVAALVGSGVARLVRLDPLSRDASTAMLAERSGRAVSAVAADKAWELCAGNPLLLEQVALAIGGGAFDAEAAERWPALKADGLLLSRFAGLRPAALRCVRAASVLGVRFRLDVAAEVAGLSEIDVDRTVEALCRSGLVEQTTAGVVRFVHPLFAQALYDDLPEPMRARLHAHSFEVLARRGLDAEAAEHALRAGLRDAPEVVAALERAGRAALDVGALETAAGQLTTAVELAAERASTSLLMAQAEALLSAGDPIAASRSYERVLSRSGIGAEVRAMALRRRGRALDASGDHATAAVCFTEAANLLLVDDPPAAAAVLVDQALSTHIVLGPKGCLPLAVRAIELAAGGGDERLRLRAAAAHGYLTVIGGDPAGLAATAAADRAVQANPRPDLADPAWTWGLTSIHAHAAKHLEHFDVAARGFRSVRLAAEQLGAAEALTMSLIGEAEVAARTGRLTEALELSTRAGELTELVPLGATYNAVVRFLVLMHLDRAAEADDCCRQLEALLDERDEGTYRIWLLHLQGIRHLGLGRSESASGVYLRAERLAEQLGIGEPCVVPWAGRAVIAHARAGRAADATRVLHWLDGGAARLPCRYPRVAAAFGRAELAGHDGDHEASERHYRDALALHEGAELAMERISTLLAYGNMLCQSGQPARGRRVLAEALEAAEAVQAPALARFARVELSATGGRRRRRTPDGRLTPQELRIARMAKAGTSRRDIAERLTLSEATVRTHLEHIYTKLDIHSARELMASKDDQLADSDTQ